MIGEKSSETLPKDARVRYIDGESDLDFKDIIMTFDYEAGAEDKWVVCCKDNTWVDPRGMPGSASSPAHIAMLIFCSA